MNRLKKRLKIFAMGFFITFPITLIVLNQMFNNVILNYALGIIIFIYATYSLGLLINTLKELWNMDVI